MRLIIAGKRIKKENVEEAEHAGLDVGTDGLSYYAGELYDLDVLTEIDKREIYNKPLLIFYILPW